MSEFIECRAGCGACCIALSISSHIPGMGGGKKAGQRCIHLNEQYLCDLFGKPERPKVCSDFQAERAVCGSNRDEAAQLITLLEIATTP